ncbi:extracellular calcium-sensing receptor [Nematostella vectensis]|uniref:extracellular calcium-sensing receptor n=1 Tax=Nematostella vectensis TaxID=45351 RepID=UPI002077024E|nr:extracellular calcium-sensing receptor [Nematostella vectensis]
MEVFLFFTLFTTSSLAYERVYKKGDVIIGSLLSAHKNSDEKKCRDFYPPGLNRVEATIQTIQQINNNSEILPNITLGYDIRDYCNSRELAMKETYDFAVNSHSALNSQIGIPMSRNKSNSTNSAVAIVGPYGSRNSLQVAGLLQVVGMAGISPSATSEELSWPFYDKFLRTVPPDNLQAKAMADLIDKFEWNYVAAVAMEHSYGIYGIRALEREALQRQTFCIGFTEYIPPQDYSLQIPGIVQKLKHSKEVKVVILWIEDSVARVLMHEAARQGVQYRVWILSDSLATKTPDFLGSDFIYLGVYLGIQPRQFRDEKYEKHLKTLTPGKSLEDGNIFWEKLWKEEFNCSALANITMASSCPCDLNINQNVFNKMYDDFIPYHVDAIYAIAHALNAIYRCTEPRGLLPNGRCPGTTPVSPDHVLLYLRNVSFQGLTGVVQFDDNGDPLSSCYDVISFQKSSGISYSKVKVGTWNKTRDSRLQIINGSIDWNLGSAPPKSVCKEPCPLGTMQSESVACCWECLQCPEGTVTSIRGATNCSTCPVTQKSNRERTSCVDLPVVALKLRDATTIFFVIAAVVGVIFSVSTLVIFIRYRRTPVVKAANKELSFTILVANSSCFALSILILVRPSDSICSVIEPIRYTALTVCVSVLFLKTMRILRAFEASAMFQWLNQQFILNMRKQLYLVLIVNAPSCILSLVWILLDPPSFKMDIISGKAIIVSCVLSMTQVGYIIRIHMVSYLIAWSLVCTWYAFKARNLPENFNEAKYIGFSMYIYLLSWITYFPVLSTLDGVYVTVVSCATLLVSSYGLLLCIFVPKLYVILRHPAKNTTHFVRTELRAQMSNRVEPTMGDP